jgi:hypothetical protein
MSEQQLKEVKIISISEYWRVGHNDWPKKEMEIIANEQGVFVNGIPVEVMFNNIQLRFTIKANDTNHYKGDMFIITDDDMEVKESISVIYKQIKHFLPR